ncbi:MAG TPA: NrsF family protein [Acetobacteraceae bacterium]|nr:NrsF family protein [Acetobacteraceae bacterium]
MSDVSRHEAMIGTLAGRLKPVRRLPPPTLRALAWCGAVLALGLALLPFADLPGLARRLAGAPDMALALAGAGATTLLAAIAAFQTSVPGRARAWALLPLPGLLLWLGASGLGCLRLAVVPGTHVAVMGETRDCLVFILGVSLPLSLVLLVMLRRACPLRPGLTAGLGGLAAAAAAATLLTLFHPYDAAATDLAVHAVAVLLVVLLGRTLGGRLLARPM